MRARLSEERGFKLTDNLKHSHDQLVTERSTHEKGLEETRQELEKTRVELARQEDRSNELSKSLQRVIDREKHMKKELREMRELLASKERIVALQQSRLRDLGSANAKLMFGLNDLHRRSPLRRGVNGMAGEASASPISADLMEMIQRLQNPGSDMS